MYNARVNTSLDGVELRAVISHSIQSCPAMAKVFVTHYQEIRARIHILMVWYQVAWFYTHCDAAVYCFCTFLLQKFSVSKCIWMFVTHLASWIVWIVFSLAFFLTLYRSLRSAFHNPNYFVCHLVKSELIWNTISNENYRCSFNSTDSLQLNRHRFMHMAQHTAALPNALRSNRQLIVRTHKRKHGWRTLNASLCQIRNQFCMCGMYKFNLHDYRTTFYVPHLR